MALLRISDNVQARCSLACILLEFPVAHDQGAQMDRQQLQEKVQAFAQRLLHEAQGDPVRALGLLVLALDGADVASADHAQRLVGEVRRVLLPDEPFNQGTAVQHLVGDLSWEGVQQCLRCGKVLVRNGRERGPAVAPGYVYELNLQLSADPPRTYEACR